MNEFYKTFKNDHIIRNEKFIPVGRGVLYDELEYSDGVEKIKFVVLKLLCDKIASALGAIVYIDGNKYQIPNKLNAVKCRKTGQEWILSSVEVTKIA